MTQQEKNNNGIWRKITWITGAIMGISAVLGLIVFFYGSQTFATKEALEKMVTREVFAITLEKYEQSLMSMKEDLSATKQQMIAQSNKLDKILFLLKGQVFTN